MQVLIRAVKWLAGRALRVLPEALVGRMLPGEYRFDASAIPAPVTVPTAPIRLFIAPANYAGQGWQWARALERQFPDVGARNMVARMSGDFKHPADNVVDVGYYAASKTWQRQQREVVASGFTHTLVEAERWPFGAVLDETVEQQVRWLLERGLSVAMVCHGTDIRLPSRHMERYPDSLFRDALKEIAPRLERTARSNRQLLDGLGLQVFVTTPDLILDVPYATWLPSIVDPKVWRSEHTPLRRPVPVVVHAPSKGATKGSNVIDPIMRRLHDEGLISYRRVSKVPHAEMPGVIRDADIVIEQIRMGDYSVAGIESMCAGRVVVGHVSEHTREHVQSTTGWRLPVVEARAETLEKVVRDIVANPEHYQAVARDGASYVDAVHSGPLTAKILERFLRGS